MCHDVYIKVGLFSHSRSCLSSYSTMRKYRICGGLVPFESLLVVVYDDISIIWELYGNSGRDLKNHRSKFFVSMRPGA
jgi:hypothetical protein